MEMSAYGNEGEQQDVHACKQRNYSKILRQDSESKGDQGLVWQTDGPGQVQQRHQPERGHWEPRIHSDTKSPFCPRWYNSAMPDKIRKT